MTTTDDTVPIALINELVDHFKSNQKTFSTFSDQLRSAISGDSTLATLLHSVKWRVKDPDHLRDKLIRKAIEAHKKGLEFDINKGNLFHKINDLAGMRLLHLHTRQMDKIHKALMDIFTEYQYPLYEAPFARTWDDEHRKYFSEIGLATRDSPSMYTSVHYVIEANTRSKITGEIQVRTLAEELWGEVDHTINYPHESKNPACKEQIKVLARVTSSCTRLVDSIFFTHTMNPENDTE
ncbi:RelA/SpoT domain-containing protein [Corallococcus aberystwythensis]|uniref:(P)ppGpp synthetase n=1 Tax=Corallococcus aberystwythensis TaxID=2316722 RepID=A0A3A8QRP6_9BACT|nr:RelA/SpoT domain-containing protein [Corallococcus aberystwythensis]RKH70428.1 (p)ppGpp synthetase [Corallococcus aberystwythensis]